MTEQDLLRALALLDAAFITWEASGQDEADLLAL